MALFKVLTYIMETLTEHPTVVPFTNLTTKLITEMAECGVTHLLEEWKW